MRLLDVVKQSVPEREDSVRLSGQVEMKSGEHFEIWFEVPRAIEHQLSDSGNPWIVAMLPYALGTGETITSELPVDVRLLENLKGLISVWCQWRPELRVPIIEAPVLPWRPSDQGVGRTAAFYSGGVDSWFTVLRHAPELEPMAIGQVDDLLTVHGFDIPLEAEDEFDKLVSTLSQGATALGRELLTVRTNLRRVDSLWARGWGWLTHAAGLAVVALVLEKRLGQALIGSAYPYGKLIPWGSHPMTDVLFSTTTLAIRHDGASFTRVEKTRLLARHPVALEHLHVCWKDGLATNCCRCAKCLRTMMALELLGGLEKSPAFPLPLSQQAISRLYIENSVEEDFIREVLDLAATVGRQDIQSAISASLKRSTRLRPLIRVIDSLVGVPLLWRLGPRLRAWFTH